MQHTSIFNALIMKILFAERGNGKVIFREAKILQKLNLQLLIVGRIAFDPRETNDPTGTRILPGRLRNAKAESISQIHPWKLTNREKKYQEWTCNEKLIATGN